MSLYYFYLAQTKINFLLLWNMIFTSCEINSPKQSRALDKTCNQISVVRAQHVTSVCECESQCIKMGLYRIDAFKIYLFIWITNLSCNSVLMYWFWNSSFHGLKTQIRFNFSYLEQTPGWLSTARWFVTRVLSFMIWRRMSYEIESLNIYSNSNTVVAPDNANRTVYWFLTSVTYLCSYNLVWQTAQWI